MHGRRPAAERLIKIAIEQVEVEIAIGVERVVQPRIEIVMRARAGDGERKRAHAAGAANERERHFVAQRMRESRKNAEGMSSSFCSARRCTAT